MAPTRRFALLWFLLIGAAMGVVMAVAVIREGGLTGAQRQFVFIRALSYWVLWALMAPLVFRLTAHFRFGAQPFLRVLAAHAVASASFAFVHSTLAVAASLMGRALMRGQPLWPPAQFFPFTERILIEWEMTIYWALVGMAHAIAYSDDARDRAVTAVRLEADLARAEVQVLQRQLQPHFLFNTLQSISALIHRDQKGADAMLGQLAQLLRLTLGVGAAAEVPLERELLHTRCYLEIERTNLGSRLRVTEDVDASILDGAVPSLLLQPLAENAVRHGIAPLRDGGTVHIAGRRVDGFIELDVVDDGIGLAPGAKAEGIGLANTRQRLRYLYGDEQSFSVSDHPDGGTIVRVRLPYRQAPQESLEEAASWRD